MAIRISVFEMPQAVSNDLPGFQNWATPPAFFAAVSKSLGPFELDVAAEAHNAKCRDYYDAKADGLARPWGPGKRVWCNPPYGNPQPWLERGWQAAIDGSEVVYLLPAATDTAWFIEAARGDLYFVSGRIQFTPPEGVESSGSPNFGSVVVHYRQKHTDGRTPIVAFVDRQFRHITSRRRQSQLQLW